MKKIIVVLAVIASILAFGIASTWAAPAEKATCTLTKPGVEPKEKDGCTEIQSLDPGAMIHSVQGIEGKTNSTFAKIYNNDGKEIDKKAVVIFDPERKAIQLMSSFSFDPFDDSYRFLIIQLKTGEKLRINGWVK